MPTRVANQNTRFPSSFPLANQVCNSVNCYQHTEYTVVCKDSRLSHGRSRRNVPSGEERGKTLSSSASSVERVVFLDHSLFYYTAGRKEKSINKQLSQDNRRLPLGIGKNVQIRVSPLSSPNKPRRLQAKEQMTRIKKSSGRTLDKTIEKGQTNQIERTTELNQGNPERSQTGEKTYQKDTVQVSENAFTRIFLDDMRELQCESNRDDDSTKKSPGQRGHSNTGAIVLSPLRSPERRSQRRKEEIHKSTSKVADWLSTHDISIGINSKATETCQTEPGCEGENGCCYLAGICPQKKMLALEHRVQKNPSKQLLSTMYNFLIGFRLIRSSPHSSFQQCCANKRTLFPPILFKNSTLFVVESRPFY